MDISWSRFDNYCEGYNLSEPGKYVLGLNLSIGTAPLKMSHTGSTMLDEINAFDRAEVEGANIGQINMITVSSFVGPRGLVWGYDLYEVEKRELSQYSVGGLRVYDANALVDATKDLLGTVDSPMFPILPGSHVPCAAKNIKKIGPAILYSAIALAIPEDRSNACLMMEDVGEIPITANPVEYADHRILPSLVHSVIEIGKNQRVKYSEVFIAAKECVVDEGEIGCALVASPYLSLARQLQDPLRNKGYLQKGDFAKS